MRVRQARDASRVFWRIQCFTAMTYTTLDSYRDYFVRANTLHCDLAQSLPDIRREVTSFGEDRMSRSNFTDLLDKLFLIVESGKNFIKESEKRRFRLTRVMVVILRCQLDMDFHRGTVILVFIECVNERGFVKNLFHLRGSDLQLQEDFAEASRCLRLQKTPRQVEGLFLAERQRSNCSKISWKQRFRTRPELG